MLFLVGNFKRLRHERLTPVGAQPQSNQHYY